MNLNSPVKVAILDLYDGVENQGMRCIREIVHQFADLHQLPLQLDEFEVRNKLEVPDTSYDVYISTGGPGSPIDSEGSEWETAYFNWLHAVETHNTQSDQPHKKYIFLICHSFQIVSRYLEIGHVSKRRSTSFGVFPIHYLEDAQREPVFEGLTDPFYAVDSRDYQLTQPNLQRIRALGAKILAIEKNRPHVPMERAIMAIRFNEYMIGTQFHPEADAMGMLLHLQSPERKAVVIENHGLAKWESMIEQLNDPDKIMFTNAHVIPNFLQQAVGRTLTVPT
ncbi:MAG: GMP synthase [Ferruginibacter sp.]|nr:GMP synthase [Ferruginibacter sp.]